MITTKYLLENTTQIKISYGTKGRKNKKLNVVASLTEPQKVQEMVEVIGFGDNDFYEDMFFVPRFMNILFFNHSNVLLNLYYLHDGRLQKTECDDTKFFQPKHFSKFLTLLKNLMPTDLEKVDIGFLYYWENIDERIEQIKITEEKVSKARIAYAEGLSLEMITQLTGFTAEQVTEILVN